MEGNAVRPTKKQRALLDFIEQFIVQHGYSPSYREIMNGCNYNSIATVAVHINNLINRGHLRKRDHSARSLELTGAIERAESQPSSDGEAWLLEKVEALVHQATQDDKVDHEDLATVATALTILGLPSVAQQLAERLESLQATPADNAV